MKDWIFWIGAAINISVGVAALGLGFMCAADWAIGKIGRHVKAYGVLIEFAFYRRDFLAWRKQGMPKGKR